MLVKTMNKRNQDKESDMSEEDKKLQEELLQAVDILQGKDEIAMLLSLNHLRMLIRTSTTSMTSVPKPLKYLRNFYPNLRNTYEKLKREEAKIRFAEILSVLALAGATPESKDCLNFCIKGAVDNPGEWGHEYVRQLEAQIVDEWTNAPIKEEREIRKRLTPLIKSIIAFDTRHNAEIQACDLCLEIDELNFLAEYLEPTNFARVCYYLISCAAYSEETERRQILEFATEQYLKFNEYTRAILVALQLVNSELVFKCITACSDSLTRNQLAFILSRLQDQPLRSEYYGDDAKNIEAILSNGHINTHFQILARELDILEPKLPEDIYKSWLVSGFRQMEHDSARANLAASFVSGFVHAGFGQDKLMANTSDCWVYKNKEHGMLSATASLGLIHMWDVDGGLIPIDKYLYTNEDYVKSGALLAIGLVNCGIRNECDPALALLSEYVKSNSQILRIGAILGLGLAYAGSRRKDVTELLSEALADEQNNIQVLSLIAISLGLVNVGSGDSDVSSIILLKLLGLPMKELVITHSRFLALALGMIYMGTRDAIETPSAALEALPEPYNFASQTMLQICAYAGTGDVLIVQELLRICSETIEEVMSAKTSENIPIPSCCDQRPQSSAKLEKNKKDSNQIEEPAKDIGASQAIASLGVGVVGLGEGKENSRIFGQVGRYGPTPARRAMPLALALSSLSNADPAVVDVLNKYSHDNDADVALNAIFALGLVGAGTNNARLATMLRQLAAYYAKNPSHLFLVRISQGLVHLGKGTLSLSPLRYSSKILDYTALAGLMVVLVACLDCRNLILSQSHYLMYCLAIAMEPRWLVTVNENLTVCKRIVECRYSRFKNDIINILQNLPVSVRIGQSVDVVGKAGNPKSIVGGHVQTTPVLLCTGEKAELVSDQYEPLSSVLEGFVILREKTVAS
ncbi:PREDICTED: 26S proteasome non-ATPase regulatory subunit 2-like isoform X2 [Trachymyrmex septentrionalis]|uniref:26S proteasome non-ATPase regulatory subunit 2-like isoform X2 n=1 Tax=Trachymyrmex septentrionalis TaxID=34720 RepID=UPI00084F2145|nr:PREDICTED: 26S proteasome non-ATPase regulatory subunit 2-like isoform X2 [Trachymyrmex septentrionalis]